MGKCNGTARAVSLHCVRLCVCAWVSLCVFLWFCLSACLCAWALWFGSGSVSSSGKLALCSHTHNRITQYTRIHYWMGLTNQCRLVHVLLLLTFYLLNILNESFSLVRQKSRQEEEENCVANKTIGGRSIIEYTYRNSFPCE